MENNQDTQEKTQATRHYARVMAFAVVAILLIAGGFLLLRNGGQVEVINPQVEETATSTEGAFDRSAPVHLNIPAVGIQADFEAPLGLNADQTIQVPETYTKVGWYKHGATPGEKGTAVILGHVDSYQGPAIFYPLGQLEIGDEIEVTRADGTIAVFVVEDMERVSQDAFPTEKVYAHTDEPLLRLVTCTGVYSHGTQRYSHNLIVYAKLKDAPESEQIAL